MFSLFDGKVLDLSSFEINQGTSLHTNQQKAMMISAQWCERCNMDEGKKLQIFSLHPPGNKEVQMRQHDAQGFLSLFAGEGNTVLEAFAIEGEGGLPGIGELGDVGDGPGDALLSGVVDTGAEVGTGDHDAWGVKTNGGGEGALVGGGGLAFGITTGEGGMVVCNNSEHAHTLMRLRSHGISSDPADMRLRSADEIWNYQQLQLGFNYRMTELQAALGLSQMQRLDAFVAQRHALAQRYDTLLADLPLVTPWQHPDSHSGLHLYVVRLRLDLIHKTHREVFEGLRAQGIGVNVHYIPVHTQPHYARMGFAALDFPNAQQYYAEAISLPMYQDLTHPQQDYVVAAMRQELCE